jgi:hypothetical protein
MRFCVYCGKPSNEGAFCAFCGKLLANDSETSEPNNEVRTTSEVDPNHSNSANNQTEAGTSEPQAEAGRALYAGYAGPESPLRTMPHEESQVYGNIAKFNEPISDITGGSPPKTSRKAKIAWMVSVGVAIILIFAVGIPIAAQEREQSQMRGHSDLMFSTSIVLYGGNVLYDASAPWGVERGRVKLRTSLDALKTTLMAFPSDDELSDAIDAVVTARALVGTEADFNARTAEAAAATAAEASKAAAAAAAAKALIKVPDGFSDWGNGIGYKALVGQGTCASGTSCLFYQLYAYKDCPSGVYIQANFLNSGGVIVGYGNDLIGSMRNGDSATATLQHYGSASNLRVTEINCY